MKAKTTKKSAKKEGLQAPKALSILVTIVNRNKVNSFIDTLEGFNANLQNIIYASGTDHLNNKQLVQMKDATKAVIISIVDKDIVKKIMHVFEDRLFKTRNGKGIAFTIPISSVIGVNLYKFLANC